MQRTEWYRDRDRCRCRYRSGTPVPGPGPGTSWYRFGNANRRERQLFTPLVHGAHLAARAPLPMEGGSTPSPTDQPSVAADARRQLLEAAARGGSTRAIAKLARQASSAMGGGVVVESAIVLSNSPPAQSGGKWSASAESVRAWHHVALRRRGARAR